jgi:ATP diphosphatase
MKELDKLLNTMEYLRDPENGCPWNQQQSLASLVSHTLEEAYEVADAVQGQDMLELQNELGDLLYQIVFYAQIAKEQGLFDFTQVVDALNKKLIIRHPHVFSSAQAESAQVHATRWEKQKAKQRAETTKDQASALDGIAATLPAISRSAKLQQRAALVGFDWPDIEPVFAKVDEEIQEFREEVEANATQTRIEEELGDIFFAVVNLARHVNSDPEGAIRNTNARFEARFRRMEVLFGFQGKLLAQVPLEELEKMWIKVKNEEKDGGPVS